MRVSSRGWPIALSASETTEASIPPAGNRHIATSASPASRQTSPKTITASGIPSGTKTSPPGRRARRPSAASAGTPPASARRPRRSARRPETGRRRRPRAGAERHRGQAHRVAELAQRRGPEKAADDRGADLLAGVQHGGGDEHVAPVADQLAPHRERGERGGRAASGRGPRRAPRRSRSRRTGRSPAPTARGRWRRRSPRRRRSAITCAGSITSRRRNEKRRCSRASGTEPTVRRKIVPAEAAASAVTVLLSKKARPGARWRAASRLKTMPEAMVAKAAVEAASSRRSRRWITAEARPDSVSSRVKPISTVAAANSPNSAGESRRARAT